MKIKVLILILATFELSYSQTLDKYHYNESVRLEEKKEYDEAILEVNKALKIDSLNIKYLEQKIKLSLQKKDCQSAIRFLVKMMEIQGPNDGSINDYLIVYNCLEKEDYQDLNALPDPLTIYQKYIDNNLYQNNEMIVNYAQELFNNGEYNKSINYYKKYVEIVQDDEDAIFDLARLTYNFGDKQDAIGMVKNRLKKNPESRLMLKFLAANYHNERDYHEALKFYNRVIEIENTKINLISRAELKKEMGNQKSAYEDYLKALELESCDIECYENILQYEFDNKFYEQVISHSNALLNCNSKYESSVLEGLYISLLFCHKFDEAHRMIGKALVYTPNNFNVYYFKVILLLMNKNYDDVLKCIDLASNSNDFDEQNYIHLQLLKIAYFLLVEDYIGLKSYWNLELKELASTTLNFTFTKNNNESITVLDIDFDRNSGAVKTTLMIPNEILKLLKEEYKITLID